ncbi:hypothetical protein CNMCM7691_000321 [Aspergillus felis]|uniref:Fucose-specific lectin n=1 Tax=Aspergillus felis TaxID=1287682 RepID=A0A8H6R062_9EURO|nr:hypothetical protein CNMCM7691_000321 [Aspergillus felis]
MATVLHDTAIAASNNGSNINVYAQQRDGSVVEYTYRPDWSPDWEKSDFLPVAAGEAKLFTPLAANVERKATGPERHVYFLDKENRVRDKVLKDNGWVQGGLYSLTVDAAPFSRLNMYYPKLYYQTAEEYDIKCVEKDTNGWTTSSFAVAQWDEVLLGTGIAALADSVFHQNDTLAIEQKGGVTGQSFSLTASPHTSLSVLGDDTYLSILYTTSQSWLQELRITDSGSTTTKITTVAPRSDIAAVRIKSPDDDPDVIQVFCQDGRGDGISAYRYIAASGWKLKTQNLCA